MVNNPQINPESTEEPVEIQEGQIAETTVGPSFENLVKLTETPPYVQEILGKLDLRGLDFKSALEEINNIIVEELEKNPEKTKDLERFKTAIERLYKQEIDKETEISPDTVGRAERDVELSEEIEKMETGQEFDRRQLAGVLERQNWGKIFTALNKGDKVLSFLVPGADFLSIKNLNDVVLGPQISNKVIAQKRIVVQEQMQKIDAEAAILQSDYKIEIVKVSKDSEINKNKLEAMSKAVDETMTAFVLKEVDDLLAIEKDEKKIDILNNFKKNLEPESGKSGFRMNYGLAEVKGSRMGDKLISLN